MRILLLGAGGFIGRHILSDLIAAGHEAIGVARSVRELSAAFPKARFTALDLATAVGPQNWKSLLPGVDAIVNAAGLLRGRDLEAVHVEMPKALYAAASEGGVKRAVLVSAISARPEVRTEYSTSKLAGEEALRSTQLDWTILRPSLVYGDGSYGGTSLIRGMAGLPLAIPVPGNGNYAFTPIHARDLARCVRMACEGNLPSYQTLEPVGPETISLNGILAHYRAWLGFGRARFLPVPLPVMKVLGRLGDLASDGPVSSTSLSQMIAGNAGDSEAFSKAVGFVPRSLDQALRDRPAQVQDRWHARLFFLAPALQAILILMWLASAWLGLAYGGPQTERFVRSAGLPAEWSDPLRIGSSVLDIAIAAQLLIDRSATRVAFTQLVVILGYTIILGVILPQLWLDPLGPLLKNLPILAAIAVYGAIGNKR